MVITLNPVERNLRQRELINPNPLASSVVMISPDHFGFNPQTASTNLFQTRLELADSVVTQKALQEYKKMVEVLRNEQVGVVALKSRLDVLTPDAVFPNNWFSTDVSGNVILYPMLAPNRRDERQSDHLLLMLKRNGFQVKNVVDLTGYEAKGMYLEGTGSMVFDNKHNVAFAMESQRTSEVVFKDFCKKFGFEPVFFHAIDKFKQPIYHTNVIMAVGDGFSVLCPESIPDKAERETVIGSLNDLGINVIAISMDQLYSYCANILELGSQDGENKIVMSRKARSTFNDWQIAQLGEFGKPTVVDIQTIETVGGGSARCMLAEVFLPQKETVALTR
jgi:hypothetical protein